MYAPLEPLRREIRVVELAPGNFNDDIHCTLRTLSLDDNPTYEALSYVWGDFNVTDFINLDGSRFEATINLKLALQHLRRSDISRVIWVDAICINQDDNVERTHQVGQMGDVYKLCTGVVVWLGMQSLDSALAFSAIEAISADTELHWDPTLTPSLDSKYLSEASAQSIASLIDRPWWHRTWTVQESILPSSLTFLCGTYQLSSTALFGVAQHYLKHGTSCCYNMGIHVGVNVMRLLNGLTNVYMLNEYRQGTGPDRSGYQGLNLLELISLYRERRCHDPRDKIYGLLGLASAGVHARLVEPDYTKPTKDVFETAAAELLHRTGGMQVLSLIFPYAGLDDRMEGLPSWAPNWISEGSHANFRDLHIRVERLVMYSASRELANSPIAGTYLGAGQLSIKAHIIATISKIGNARESHLGPDQISVFKSWHQLAQVDANRTHIYPSHISDLNTRLPRTNSKSISFGDAYILTLCASVTRATPPFQPHRMHDADGVRNIYNAWWNWVDVHNGNPLEMSTIDPESAVSLNELGNFVNDVSVSTSMRRLFLTSGDLGLIGLAPRNAQVGDVVAVIEGALVPFILRGPSDSDGEKTWKMVGDSYVHGIMDGEGMDFPAERIILT